MVDDDLDLLIFLPLPLNLWEKRHVHTRVVFILHLFVHWGLQNVTAHSVRSENSLPGGVGSLLPKMVLDSKLRSSDLMAGAFAL